MVLRMEASLQYPPSALFRYFLIRTDLHYGNIGVRLPKLYEHSEDDILDYFGHPEVSLVLPRKPPTRPESLPPYIVESIALGNYYKAKTPSFTDSAICTEIIDLGSGQQLKHFHLHRVFESNIHLKS